jgi:uncharacterized protein YukE
MRAGVRITEQKDVKELLGILRENNISAPDLVGVINHLAAMERELGKASTDLSAMRRELAEMREEAGHPIRTALQNAAKGLAAKIKSARSALSALKDKIIYGCRRAVTAFKAGGVAALNNLSGFFNVRSELTAARDAINDAIRYNEGQIGKIERAAEAYHEAGRAIRNIGRSLRGEEPVPAIKPNGKLARLVAAPFRTEHRRLNRSLNRVNKALACIDRLEKAAERQAKHDRPSTLDEMKRLQVVVAEKKKETPAKEKQQQTEAAM